MSWTVEELKSELSKHREIKAWIVTRDHIRRRERYLLNEKGSIAVDQDRAADKQVLHLQLFVDIGKPGRQGEMSLRVDPRRPLTAQISSAVEGARQSDHQAWELPTALTTPPPKVLTADPRIAEDMEGVMNGLTARLQKSALQPKGASFNSSEIFLSLVNEDLWISNGFSHSSSRTSVYAEAAYSSSKSGAKTASGNDVESDEFLSTTWSVGLDDLKLEELLVNSAENATHMLKVSKPESGKYSVLVHADVLAEVFHSYLGRLSSSSAYHGLPFIKPGEDYVPGAKGDLVTLDLDPSLPFGAASTAVSSAGLVQKPLRLVEKNKVVASSTGKRFADYLKQPVTTSEGNLVVSSGSKSLDELRRADERVVEILQFSALFPDESTGTFSSEIRLARLIDNRTGERRYLKGGSLSGSMADNFTRALFSRERARYANFGEGSGMGYEGPAAALLNDVSIVG
jgi:predicted Zn-dependent protease